MNKLKRDLRRKFYIEAPDQLEQIKSKIELKKTDNLFLRLKKQNIFLKYSNIVFACLLLIVGILVIGQVSKPKDAYDRVSITEYIDVTLRTKVREENIKDIYGIILPLNESDRTLFIQTFNNFKLERFNQETHLDDYDYLYYKVVFNDNSSIVVKVYENNMVEIEVEGHHFYSYEYNAYDILN